MRMFLSSAGSFPCHHTQALAGVLVLSVEKIRALGFKGPPPGSRVNSSPLTAQPPPAPPKRHPELGESPLSQMKPHSFSGSLPLNVTHPSTPAGTFQVHAHRQVFPNCSNSFLVSIGASSPSPPGARVSGPPTVSSQVLDHQAPPQFSSVQSCLSHV